MFARFRIGTIVTSCAALLMAVIIGLSLIGSDGMRRVSATAENLNTDTIPCVFKLATLMTDIDVVRVRLMRMALSDNAKAMADTGKELSKGIDDTDAAVADYKKVADLDPKEKAIFDEAAQDWLELRASVVKSRDALFAGKGDVARAQINGDLVKIARKTRKAFDADFAYNRDDANNHVNAIRETGDTTLRNTILVGLLGMVTGLGVITVFQRGRIRFDADLVEASAGHMELYAKMGERLGEAP